jgi:nucleotide-binding universal stress UspA family protein
MNRTIVLAVDDSKHALFAVDAVRDLAGCIGDDVLVLHIHEVTVTHGGRARIDATEGGDDFLSGFVDRLSADEVDARLVAVGSRGRSDIAALALGSISHQLVYLAHRPVLVCRHP